MGWQFQIDGRRAGPVRDSWQRAAQDAVNDGYAKWLRSGVAIDDQAAIVQVDEKPEHGGKLYGGQNN